MFNSIKKSLLVITAVIALAMPTAASAFVPVDPGGSSAASEALRPVPPPSSVAIARPTAVASQGFQWADAGIGAAAVLVLVVLGSAAVATTRSGARFPL